MRMAKRLGRAIAPVAVSILIGALATACQPRRTADGVQIDDDDIGGVVTSENGPEAGAWVIAETEDFDTRFARIVVTDDRGRYLVPDLPEADYSIWVRGYGLADSAGVEASPGTILNLTSRVAPDPETAAQVYPAAYWYSMMSLPEETEVEDIPGGMKEYLAWMKNLGCIGCHQLVVPVKQTVPYRASFEHVGLFEECRMRRRSR